MKKTQAIFSIDLYTNGKGKKKTVLRCQHFKRSFKDTDTVGNCQRPVFSLDVSQHMHQITTCDLF